MTVGQRRSCAPRLRTNVGFGVVLLLLSIAAAPDAVRSSRPPGWNDQTHGRDAEPDYGRVFAQDRVNRIDIQVAAADWDTVVADMADMVGSFGGQGTIGQPGGGIPGGGGPGGGVPGGGAPGGGGGLSAEAVAACTGKIEGNACSFGTPPVSGRCVQTPTGTGLACFQIGQGGGGGAVGGGGQNAGRDDVELLPRTPVYVPARVAYDGATFHAVGFRLKGNSSLLNSWRSGNAKLPFRLNFDALEVRMPDIRDQTFFGFPNLAFTNNVTDASYLRAKVVGDLFREAGLPSARTAFMRVYLDRGSGAVYLGLYTMVEVPDSPMLNTQFGSDNGNLYKPSGTGGRWTVFDPESFPKKTNAVDEDWTDIEDAIRDLNASRQDATTWRTRLEARFEAKGFLRWLALNTIVGNFDAYGGLSPHNYYVYGSPRHRDRLFWIPWDHDLALNGGGLGGGGGAGTGTGTGTVDLFHTGIDRDWPLIRFLLDDPVYRATYRAHVEDLLATVFESSRLTARLRTEQTLIVEYVIGASGEQAARLNPAPFDAALYGAAGLLEYVQSRAAGVRRALGAAP